MQDSVSGIIGGEGIAFVHAGSRLQRHVSQSSACRSKAFAPTGHRHGLRARI